MAAANKNEMKYLLIFERQLKEEANIGIVKEKLKKLFNNKSERVDQLFRKEKIVLRKNLSKEQAIKYKTIFESSGALCTIKVMNVSNKKQPPVTQSKKIQSETIMDNCSVSNRKTEKIANSPASISTLFSFKKILWVSVILIILAAGFWFTSLSEMTSDSNITVSTGKPDKVKSDKGKPESSSTTSVLSGYLLF